MIQKGTVLRFGGFELDQRSGELLRAGRRLHLPPQSIHLLAMLAQRPGVLLSRDEIRQALWSDGTFVDFESAVNVCVSQIRAALRDKATAPRFIETLPRRGYRFVAPVEVVDGPSAAVAPAPRTDVHPAARPDASDLRRWRIGAAFGATLACTVGVLVLVAASSTSSSNERREYVKGLSVTVLQKFERARAGLEDASPTELADRVRFFNQAIGAAPDFAEAYVGLADAELILGSYRGEDPSFAYAAAKAAAAKALAIDPALAEAHATYAAAVLLLDWDWTTAARHFERASLLPRKTSRVHHWYSRYLTARGRHRQARDQAERAAKLAPTSPSAATYLGVAAFYAGDITAARQHCRRAVALMPEFLPAVRCLDATEAPAQMAAALPDLYLQPSIRAAASGDAATALDGLQRAANRHADALIFASVQPGLRSLHAQPQFQMILERVGLRPALNPAQ